MPMTANNHARNANARKSIALDTSRIEHSPGKFQGEPLYVGAYWDAALDGAASIDLYAGGTLVSCFELEAADYARHPGLAGVDVLALWEDSDGFVWHRVMTQPEYEAWREQAEAVDCATEDDDD